MKRSVLLLAVFVASGLLAASVQRVDAVDLTGTWEGKISCKGIEDGAKEKFTCCETIQITQTGDTINLREEDLFYFGRVLSYSSDPDKGTATFIGCGTDNTLGLDAEMVFADVSVDGAKGTLRGKGAYNEDNAAQFLCTWSYRRVNTANPNVPPC